MDRKRLERKVMRIWGQRGCLDQFCFVGRGVEVLSEAFVAKGEGRAFWREYILHFGWSGWRRNDGEVWQCWL